MKHAAVYHMPDHFDVGPQSGIKKVPGVASTLPVRVPVHRRCAPTGAHAISRVDGKRDAYLRV